MTSNLKYLTLSLTTALITFFLSNSANAGFCGNYIQTASNAGHCKTCRLQIADNPEIQKYFVSANNGWQAELSWTHGDDSVATGSGRWDRNVGHSLAGKRFNIDMNQQSRTLRMTMSVPGSGNSAPIQATYRCLD